jgi:diamine N-acetyltransferase
MLLKGELIFLRAIEPNDLEPLYLWENDSNVWHLSNTIAPFSRHTLKEYIENAKHDIYVTKQLRLMICKHNNEVIGCIDLFEFDPTNLRAGIGILVGSEKHRGKGYAAESLELLCNYCFSFLHLHQLYCHINSDNMASINLFEKTGFKQSGVKKMWNRTQGGWVDEHFYQLIAY